MKELLIWTKQSGLKDEAYYLFHLLSFLVAVPFFGWLSKKMNVGRVRSFLALLVNCIVFLVLMNFIGWVEASLGLGNFGRKNVVTVYALIPVICYLSSWLCKIDHKCLCTMMAPTMPLIQMVSRPGCLFAGCCKGFPCDWGIYNVNTEDFRIPMPAIEMLWLLAVVLVVMWALRRKAFRPSYGFYPFMMVIYGACQFVFEFFIDNQKILGRLSLRSFYEIMLVVVGSAWLLSLYIMKKRRERAEFLASQPLPKKHKITAVVKK